MGKHDKPKVYDSREEAEAAQARGETVDYSTVKGDDGLTDDERRLEKLKASQKGGEVVSAGTSSSTSPNPVKTSDGNESKAPQSNVPTTGSPSSPVQPGNSTASSTGGSGTAGQSPGDKK